MFGCVLGLIAVLASLLLGLTLSQSDSVRPIMPALPGPQSTYGGAFRRPLPRTGPSRRRLRRPAAGARLDGSPTELRIGFTTVISAGPSYRKMPQAKTARPRSSVPTHRDAGERCWTA